MNGQAKKLLSKLGWKKLFNIAKKRPEKNEEVVIHNPLEEIISWSFLFIASKLVYMHNELRTKEDKKTAQYVYVDEYTEILAQSSICGSLAIRNMLEKEYPSLTVFECMDFFIYCNVQAANEKVFIDYRQIFQESINWFYDEARKRFGVDIKEEIEKELLEDFRKIDKNEC
jgi:hypothetical protein